jgi:predicted nucleotidyltransferase component of viral defense system
MKETRKKSMDALIRKARAMNLDPLNYIREIFQKLIIYAVAHLEVEDFYVLQGGTALRLFYGSPRTSLDLDFTLVKRSLRDSERDSKEIMNLLERLLAPYNVKVSITGAKLSVKEDFYRFFFVFDTLSWLEKKIKVKIEVIRRVYRDVSFNRTIAVVEFPFSTSVGTLTKFPSQLLADKVTSLAGGYHRGYIRWRDVFDVYWLTQRLKAELDFSYLIQEFGTFIEKPKDLVNLTNELKSILSEKKLSEAKRELEKLLHKSLLEDTLVEEYLQATINILEKASTVICNETS